MAKMFNLLQCLLGLHDVQRRAVQYDGSAKSGPCKYCGTMLEKRGDGSWKRRRKE